MSLEPRLRIGIHGKKETQLFLTEKERARHMHVVGRTGSGKSKLLEWMIREDIKAGRGLLLLDPHGDLYRSVLTWVIEQRLDRKRLFLIDQNRLDWAVGLNYLDEPGMTAEWIAGRAQDGIAKVFGDERQEAMPIVRNWLPAVLKALILAGLRLSEGRIFLDDPAFRHAVLQRIRKEDPDLVGTWQAYDRDRRTQEIAVMAVRNRLMPFASEEMRPVVGQDRNTVDWLQVMQEGGAVLANLAPERVSPQSQQMLGIIILHQLVGAAKRRREEGRRRFYVYCDEFQSYVTEEFARVLEEMRKFQVSFVLAHQHLGQIERAGEWILQSIISQPGIRVVFHPGNRADAEVLARELFTGTPEVTGRRVKDELMRTFYEPRIAWEEVESVTVGDSYGGSDSWTEHGFESSSTDAHSESTTRSSIPVTHHIEHKELASRTYYSLEEEWEKATAWIMRLPDRHALLHVRGRRPMRLITTDVRPPLVTRGFLEKRTDKALQASSRPREQAEAEIMARRAEVKVSEERSATGSGAKRLGARGRQQSAEIPSHPGLIEQE